MKNYIIILLLSLGVLTSCTKVGPTGPMGPSGRNGQDGSQGEAGADGSIPKVYYFDITLDKFMYESYNEAWNTYAFMDNVTIETTDMVMAFVNLSTDGNGDNYWQAMPYNEYLDNTEFYIQHSFGVMGIDDDSGNGNYLTGDLILSLRASDGLAPYNDMSSTTGKLRYNIYVLKGEEGRKATLPENIDPKNQKEVVNYLSGIK